MNEINRKSPRNIGIRTLIGFCIGIIGVIWTMGLTYCAKEVFSPEVSFDALRETTGIALVPIVKNIDVSHTNIHPYGSTVITVEAEHPEEANSNLEIVYDFRYLDTNGEPVAQGGSGISVKEIPPHLNGKAYYTPMDTKATEPYEATNMFKIDVPYNSDSNTESEPAPSNFQRGGVQVRVYYNNFRDINKKSESAYFAVDNSDATVFVTNIRIYTIPNPTGNIVYSHHFTKIYIEASKGKIAGFYYLEEGIRPFVRVSATHLSSASDDPLNIKSRHVRSKNTLEIYFYIAHPEGTLSMLTYPVAEEYTPTNIDSEWNITFISDQGTQTTFNHPTNTNVTSTEANVTGTIVYQEPNVENIPEADRGTYVYNSKGGQVHIQPAEVPGLDPPIQKLARRYEYVAGVIPGTATLKVVFTHGTQKTKEISIAIDVLNKANYDKRRQKIYPKID